jgi:dipeptidyl aminopeptidase/acylaminoacyl peptidase
VKAFAFAGLLLASFAGALGCRGASEASSSTSAPSPSYTSAGPAVRSPAPSAALAASSSASAQALSDRSSASLPISRYAEARATFKTHLLRKGPAPQQYQPISPPPSARAISYASGKLKLKAWVSAPPPDGQRRPAVLFLHGGFAFGNGDWEMTAPYRDAGFVVLAPMLRGENGLPGEYSMFFLEIDDVLAAAEALAGLPYVRTDRLYVAGHSVGGTLTLLAAMNSRRFRAAASFSGSPDQVAFSKGNPEIVPFDPTNVEELQIRSPIAYAGSFQCPLRAYYGSDERYFARTTAQLADQARQKGRDVRDVSVPGDHMSHVTEAMKQSIEFFRQNE